MYNVTLRHICETFVAMDKQEVVHILRERERESACVYAHVALVIQYAKHMVPYYVVI